MKSTNGASECCERTSQLSLFGETCEPLPERTFFPTPTQSDGTRDGKAYRKDTNMFEGGSHSVQLSHLAAHGLLLPTPQAQLAKHGAATEWERENRPNHLHVMASTSSPQAIPASHSHSPGSDWARKMTATYGRKLSAYWLSCDPPDSWVRTLLGTSIWGSTTCYLTWKKSVTPRGRLLFRLVPSTPRTAGIGSGLWGTPTSRDHKDTGSMENVPVNGLLGRQDLTPELYPTALAQSPATGHRQSWTRLAEAGQITHEEAHRARIGALNSAWVSRMMGYPDGWLTLDGEATQ